MQLVPHPIKDQTDKLENHWACLSQPPFSPPANELPLGSKWFLELLQGMVFPACVCGRVRAYLVLEALTDQSCALHPGFYLPLLCLRSQIIQNLGRERGADQVSNLLENNCALPSL